MCGFLVTIGGSKAFTHRDLSPLRRRGPDGIGFWTDGKVSIAQTRLAIVGLDDRSLAPLENKRYVLAFNGEIYNFLAIARKITGLEATSDTQVLLDAWTAIGADVLELLEGFWSFAIYDKEAQRLTLCRDQFGTKPLYYTLQPDAFVASSTLQPLLSAVEAKPALDFATMSVWARYQLTTGPQTFHRGVLKVRPAELLEYDLKDRACVHRTYERIWDIYGGQVASEGWVRDARGLLARCIDDAATSDTAVTSTCSGGLDSSLVTRLLGPEVAYHANFTDPDCNETKWARAALETTPDGSCDTRLMVVNAREEFDLVERLEDLVKDFDELSIGSVILPLDDLFAQVARRFKVVLLGTGGDELFGGYARYAMAFRECQQESYQEAQARLTGSPLERFEQCHAKGDTSLFRFYEPASIHWAFAPGEDAEDMQRHQMLKFDRQFFLGGLLGIDDKIAGRHGLEGRPALLHQRFVRKILELAPAEMQNKNVLRRIARGILPDAVIDRTDKMGFTTPIGTIVNANASRIRETLSSSRFRDLYNLRRLSFTAETKYSREVFGLLELDCWLRRYA